MKFSKKTLKIWVAKKDQPVISSRTLHAQVVPQSSLSLSSILLMLLRLDFRSPEKLEERVKSTPESVMSSRQFQLKKESPLSTRVSVPLG